MVWMSIIHGSTGIVYFVHQFKPSFNEHALLNDPEMLGAVTKVNQQIQSLAPVIFSSNSDDLIQVKSSDPAVPVACMVKQMKNEMYIFAVNMRNHAGTKLHLHCRRIAIFSKWEYWMKTAQSPLKTTPSKIHLEHTMCGFIKPQSRIIQEPLCFPGTNDGELSGLDVLKK